MRTRKSLFSTAVLIGGITIAVAAHGAVFQYRADLNAQQEGGSVKSNAFGTAVITIDTVKDTLFYTLSFQNLTSTQTAAHFHGFAAPGVNAGVLQGIGPGSPKTGFWAYGSTQSTEDNILAGLTYINVHTSVYPGGEIRGQVVPVAATPAVSPWGVGALSALVLGSGAFVLWRRRRVAA